MRQEVTVAMSINHHPGDQVPVTVGDTVVGVVIEVRATYVLDGQEHTMVVMDIDDRVFVAALEEHMVTQQPVFQVFFPRSPGGLDHIFNKS